MRSHKQKFPLQFKSNFHLIKKKKSYTAKLAKINLNAKSVTHVTSLDLPQHLDPVR